MMNNWFECKVAHNKVMENGLEKKVTESYIIEALSFTEAEARLIEYIRPFIDGEFLVTAVGRKKYSEVFNNDSDAADLWFHAKLMFVTLDERTGAEKKTACFALVQAADIREAIKHLDAQMRGTLCDYVIAEMKETAIMDVLRYEAEEV